MDTFIFYFLAFYRILVSQNKVDLFNDLYGDIKNTFTLNEKREKNSLMYTSPTMAGFTLNADLIASEDNRTDAEKVLNLSVLTVHRFRPPMKMAVFMAHLRTI